MITRQNSRERPRDIEEEEEEVDGEKESEGGEKRQDTRGRSRQQSHPLVLKPPSSRAQGTDATTLTRCAPSQPGAGPMSAPPFSQRHKVGPKPSESPFRKRLMSPFRALRERSQSNERPKAVRPRQIKTEALPSSKEDRQEGERARRSVSPNPFLWLCRARHVRSKTV